jgi:hypothetical protein
MRILLSVIAITVFFSTFANAQEEKAIAKEISQLQSYTLTLVEFRMKTPEGNSVTPDSIAKDFEKLATAGSLAMNETLRFSILESFPTSVLFGKSIAVTTGVTQGVNGKIRNLTQRQLGTSVKATAEPVKDKVLVKLSYQATRNMGEVKEDAAPDIETINVETSLLLEFGKRVVVASTTASDSGFLMVTVSR